MNVLVLMAGDSEAFREAGYAYPKNLVEVDGLPLLQRVVESLQSLRDDTNARFTFLVPTEENRHYHTADVLRLLIPDAIVLEAPGKTAGAACTALLAVGAINDGEPLLIANGDQIVRADLPAVVRDFRERHLDGGTVVFDAVHPRWSYVRCDPQTGLVVETAEKRPISRMATAGLYYFARGTDFVRATMDMIKKDAHVGGNFYICPVYNELILRQARIGVFAIDRHDYFSLANPRSVQDYEDHLKAAVATPRQAN